MLIKKGDFVAWTGEEEKDLFFGRIVRGMLVAARDFNDNHTQAIYRSRIMQGEFDYEEYYQWLSREGYLVSSSNSEKFEWNKIAGTYQEFLTELRKPLDNEQ
jgi:hypothetical protein